MDVNDLEQYLCDLDNGDKTIIDNRVAEQGIEKYLTQQLIYLDCSRIKDNMRLIQTIGYPYQREISSYLYALHNYIFIDTDRDVWYKKLLDKHSANLEYEKENPPIWYGGKKAKDKWDKEHNKLPRRRNKREQTIPGMGKEISNAERLRRLSAEFGNIKFNLKPPKKHD